MSSNIQPMGIGGVRHLVERAYRESRRLQFVREVYKNAVETGATEIVLSPESAAVESVGVCRLLVADHDAHSPQSLTLENSK